MNDASAEVYVRRKERERWVRYKIYVVATLSMLVSGAAAIASFNGFLDTKYRSSDAFDAINSSLNKQYATVNELDSLKNQISDFRKAIAVVPPAIEGQQRLEIAAIDAKISSVSKRLEQLESAISNDPVKALSLPLLRRDYENLSRTLVQDRASYKEDMSRIWQFLFLILSGVGSIGVGISVWLFRSANNKPDKTLVSKPTSRHVS